MSVNEYKVLKILFIKGAFIKDCIPIDDLFEQRIIEQLNTDTPIVNYSTLPSTFTDIKTWVKSTNLKCWHCDLNFDNQPIFIPRLIEPTETGYTIGTYGCFCSFCCASAYNNIYNHKICDNIRVKEMLLFLYKIFTGTVVREIFPASSKFTMIPYGGDVDPMTYRINIHALNNKMNDLALNRTKRT